MSGSFTPIPNFTGVNAGQQFREAINNALGGIVAISPQIVGGSISGATANYTFFGGSVSPELEAAGSSQSTATPLESQTNIVTSGSGGVALTTEALPLNTWITVVNALSEVISVWPPSGASFIELGENDPATLPANAVDEYMMVTVDGATTVYVK
jgi:hypothetical protein